MNCRKTKLLRYARLGLSSVLLNLYPAMLWAETTSAVDLPSIGDRSERYVTPTEERRLGEAFMRNVRRSLKLVEQPDLNDYIQSLGYHLVAHADSRLAQYDFFLVDNPEVNAFAGPGGYIGVNTGLVLATRNESELAAVLAHELAHIDQRHLARTLESVSRMSIPTAAGIIAAIILGGIDNQLGQAALAATTAGSLQKQINFTRTHEAEADHVGIRDLAAAGFDPRAMAGFFERLQQVTRFDQTGLPEFLRTHPVTTARIADARSRAAAYKIPAAGDELSYHLVKAKLRVLISDNPANEVSYFARALDGSADLPPQAARYGYVLALLAAGDPAEARRQLGPLLEEPPARIAYLLAAADIELDSGNTQAAINSLAEGLAFHPGNRALTLRYAQALLAGEQAKKADALLRAYVAHQSRDPAVYELLAQARAQLGMKIGAHLALAEFHYLSGQTPLAVQQLELASGLVEKDDAYHRALIDARLRELRDENRESSQR